MALLALVLHGLLIGALVLSNEGTFTEISDLGNLLLGGFVLAVVLAVALTFVRLHLRDKKPPAPQFISINSSDKEE